MTNSVKRYQLPVAGRRWAVAIAAILPAFALFAERQPYERYQSVVDRQMFGQPPAGFDPTKNPSEVSAKDSARELTKEQEQVKSAIHFSIINVTPAGETAVGFTDNSDSKSPKHYYLKVGETRDGWTVKEADALAATMTIAKGDIEVSLELGGDSSGGSGTKKVSSASSGVPKTSPAFGGRPASDLLNSRSNGPNRGIGSLRERRAQRMAEREAAAAAAAEEKRLAAEKEAQREAERAAEKEAERAEREAERAEMQKKLKDMADAIRKQQEEAAAKQQEEVEKVGGGTEVVQ